MAVDLNMDMGEVIKGLLNKNKGGADNSSDTSASDASVGGESLGEKVAPFLNMLIIFAVIGAASFSYYKFHYLVKVGENLKTQEEISRLQELKKQTTQLEAKIVAMKQKLNESKEEYLESLSHFGNSEDLGELYHSISILAEKYDLKVLNIKEMPKAPAQAEPLNSKGKKGAFKKKSLTEVNEVKVKVELKGPYIQYIKFKEDLAVAEMLLKINEEVVKVKKEEVGKIYAKLTLTTYAIDKKPFEKVITTGVAEE